MLALVLVRGVLSFVPDDEATGPASRPFPAAQASAAAAQTVAAFLAPELGEGQRLTALGLFGAPSAGEGGNPPDQSFAPTSTRVEQVIPGDVDVVDPQHATVTVLASLVTTKGEGEEQQDQRQWVALSVPVVAEGEQVAVDGTPAFVGVPEAATAPQEPARENDSVLASQTRDGAAAFFEAYGGDDPEAVEQAAAPGASIRPVGGGVVTFASLDAWTVDAGTGETRTGHATVSWAFDNKTTIRQRYRVELTSTSSATATSWRVSAVRADH